MRSRQVRWSRTRLNRDQIIELTPALICHHAGPESFASGATFQVGGDPLSSVVSPCLGPGGWGGGGPGGRGAGGPGGRGLVLLSLCALLCPMVALCPREERGTLPVSLSFGYYFRGSSGHRVSCQEMAVRIGVSDAWSQAGFLNAIPQLPQHKRHILCSRSTTRAAKILFPYLWT